MEAGPRLGGGEERGSASGKTCANAQHLREEPRRDRGGLERQTDIQGSGGSALGRRRSWASWERPGRVLRRPAERGRDRGWRVFSEDGVHVPTMRAWWGHRPGS